MTAQSASRDDRRAAREAARAELLKGITADARAVIIALIQNPAVTILLVTVVMNELYKAGKLSQSQMLAIEASMLAPSFISGLQGILPLLAKAL